MTGPRPATRHHDPDCRGCAEYALLLGREATAHIQFSETARTMHDTLRDLRSRLVAYLKQRHPLRTEDLKQRGHPLGSDTDTSMLLAALAQWDQMRDAALRAEIARGVEAELAALRERNDDLEQRAAAHTAQRHHDNELYFERIRVLTEQVDSVTARLDETGNDRREVSGAVARLADHITAGGGALPTLLRPADWYRQWSDSTGVSRPQPKTRPATKSSPPPADPRAESTADRYAAVVEQYQPDWGGPLLHRLWAGSCWTRSHTHGDGPRQRVESFVDQLIKHGLLTIEDPGQARILAVTDALGTFAADVGAELHPRRPSPAARVADAMADAEPAVRLGVLRAMAAAGRDHHVATVDTRGGGLPLLTIRPRTGPRMPARWLLPWLPSHANLVTDLLDQAHRRDPDAGLAIAVRRQGDGADDADWGEFVRTAGFDPAEVKRIWLDPPQA